jgi:hypothetical protein
MHDLCLQLASKTMIEILPPNLAAHVEKKCGSLAGQHKTKTNQGLIL